MARLLRLALVLAALLVAAGIGLVLLLPRLLDDPAVHARIQQVASDTAGREVRYASLDVGLLPPTLVVEGARIGKGFEAREVHLELAVRPLLQRRVVVRSLRVEEGTLRLVRTAAGLRAPGGAGGREAGGEAPVGPPPVRRLALDDCVLELRDRAAPGGEVTWSLQDADGQLRVMAAGRRYQLEVAGVLGSGGGVQLAGEVDLDGDLDLELRLDGMAAGPLRAYLPQIAPLAGSVDGRMRLAGPTGAPDRLEADLVVEDADLGLADLALAGRVTLDADLSGAPLAGPLHVDASEASLEHASGRFRKPEGLPADVRGRLVVSGANAPRLEEADLHLHHLEARGRLARDAVVLSSPAFALAGWEALFPALQALDPEGTLALDEAELRFPPGGERALLGRARLRELRLPLASGGAVLLTGTLEGQGDRLAASGLSIEAGDQRLAAEGGLAPLFGDTRYQLSLSGDGLDAKALARALGGGDGRLDAPLSLDARLHGTVRPERPALEDLAGSVRFDAGPGRLERISLLRATFEHVGVVGRAAHLAVGMLGADRLMPFYDEEIVSLSGSFEIAGGVARTGDLVVERKHHRFELTGAFDLVDRSIDATGELVLGPRLDAALAGLWRGKGDHEGQRRVIPLAHVGGTLDEPEVRLTRRAALAFIGFYSLTQLPAGILREGGEAIRKVLP